MLEAKRRRILRELSQKKLGVLTNLSQAQVSLIEAGRLIPTDKQRKNLAFVLGCAPERLLDIVPDPGDGAEFHDARREERVS